MARRTKRKTTKRRSFREVGGSKKKFGVSVTVQRQGKEKYVAAACVARARGTQRCGSGNGSSAVKASAAALKVLGERLKQDGANNYYPFLTRT